ncbi:MAG: hypothetical protein VW683_00120 [Betaproteobacteria bacterium]|jgi:hypothetical protein
MSYIHENKFIWFEFPRTGTRTTLRVFEETLNPFKRHGNSHLGFNTRWLKSEDYDFWSENTIVVNIRNPFEWYHSIWAYTRHSCKNQARNEKGKSHLAQFPFTLPFEDWFWGMHSKNYERFHHSCNLACQMPSSNGFNLPKVQTAEFLEYRDTMGYMTVSLLKMFHPPFPDPQTLLETTELPNNVHWLRLDNLVEDIKNIPNMEWTDEQLRKIELIGKRRHNQGPEDSSYARLLAHKYTNSMRELIYDRDRLIFDKFGYTFNNV